MSKYSKIVERIKDAFEAKQKKFFDSETGIFLELFYSASLKDIFAKAREQGATPEEEEALAKVIGKISDNLKKFEIKGLVQRINQWKDLSGRNNAVINLDYSQEDFRNAPNYFLPLRERLLMMRIKFIPHLAQQSVLWRSENFPVGWSGSEDGQKNSDRIKSEILGEAKRLFVPEDQWGIEPFPNEAEEFLSQQNFKLI